MKSAFLGSSWLAVVCPSALSCVTTCNLTKQQLIISSLPGDVTTAATDLWLRFLVRCVCFYSIIMPSCKLLEQQVSRHWKTLMNKFTSPSHELLFILWGQDPHAEVYMWRHLWYTGVCFLRVGRNDKPRTDFYTSPPMSCAGGGGNDSNSKIAKQTGTKTQQAVIFFFFFFFFLPQSITTTRVVSRHVFLIQSHRTTPGS